MAAIKQQIGTMACMCCGHEIPVRKSDGGTVHVPCQWCEFPAYAKAGTKAHRIIMGKMKPDEPDPEKEESRYERHRKIAQAAALQAPSDKPKQRAAQAAPAAPASVPTPPPKAPSRARNSIFDLG